MIKVKSAHAKPVAEDGERILVDLFWPEGLKTWYAKVDHWYNQLGPSYDLQRFYFDRSKWQEYRAAYEQELLSDPEKVRLMQQLADKARNRTITFLYGNKDT